MNSIEAEVHGETFHFYAERALHWPARKILAITDLHLGKAETFQQNGLWLPQQAQEDDLARLSSLLRRLECEKLLILGDLIHTKKGMTTELIDHFAAWMEGESAEIHVLLGNHDRHFARTWPRAWANVIVADAIQVGKFCFRHELEGETAELNPHAPPDLSTFESRASADQGDEKIEFIWLGHLHPAVLLRDGPTRLRLACFHLTSSVGFLPAFSSLAGGENIIRQKGDRVFATSLEENWIGAIR